MGGLPADRALAAAKGGKLAVVDLRLFSISSFSIRQRRGADRRARRVRDMRCWPNGSCTAITRRRLPRAGGNARPAGKLRPGRFRRRSPGRRADPGAGAAGDSARARMPRHRSQRRRPAGDDPSGLGIEKPGGGISESGPCRERHPPPNCACCWRRYAPRRTTRPARCSALKKPRRHIAQMEFSDLPKEVWDFLYPQAYWKLIERQARLNNLDPYLVMGLVRQESAFNAARPVRCQCPWPDADSAGNCGPQQPPFAHAQRRAAALRSHLQCAGGVRLSCCADERL